MKVKVKDQLNRSIQLPRFPPQRIVSLVPSQTELLFDLGLEQRVVGITKFCVHPAHWRKTKTVIGGTKQLHLEKIVALQPDLIIANQEENPRDAVLTLAEQFSVWTSKVTDLPSALALVERVGELTATQAAAQQLVTQINTAFQQLPSYSSLRCAYLIWRKPYMVSGGDTFIEAMLQRAGFSNVFAHHNRYPSVSADDLRAASPEVLLLSSEPFPFREKHLTELRHICPQAVPVLVDGELFSWYGSRLRRSPAYFANLRERIEKLTP